MYTIRLARPPYFAVVSLLFLLLPVLPLLRVSNDNVGTYKRRNVLPLLLHPISDAAAIQH